MDKVIQQIGNNHIKGSIKDMTIKSYISNESVTCSPDTPLWLAAEKMATHKASSIIIMENDKPIGIWTERDTLNLQLGNQTQYSSEINKWMSSPVITVDANEPVYLVIARMQKDNIRHYLVTEDQKPIGVVGHLDLITNPDMDHILHRQSVNTVTEYACITAEEDTSLDSTVEKMKTGNHSAILVRYKVGHTGIITEVDILKTVAKKSLNCNCGDVANYPLITIHHNDSLFNARNVFIKCKIRHLGVVNDEDTVTGILNFRKLLAHFEYHYINELKHRYFNKTQALALAQHQLQVMEKVMESSLDGVMITDMQGKIISVNPAFTFITGYSANEIMGKKPSMLKSGAHDDSFYTQMWASLIEKGQWQGEIWNKKKGGTIYKQLLSIFTVNDSSGKKKHLLAIIKDLSIENPLEDNGLKFSYNNPVTGLPNYKLLRDRLKMVMANSKRGQKPFSLIHTHLNRFKTMQESIGYKESEYVMKVIASRLKGIAREQDTLAHITINEFVLIVNGTNDKTTLIQILNRLEQVIAKPVEIGQHELFLTASFGILTKVDYDERPDNLIQNVIISNTRQINSSSFTCHFYHKDTDDNIKEKLTLEGRLRKAINNKELSLYYQPIVETNSRKIKGFEALSRWEDKEKGFITPNDFIPIAEESGLILPLGEWVINQAFTDYFKLKEKYGDDIYISINISTRQLLSANFVNKVDGIVKKHGIPRNAFLLEITENILFDSQGDNLEILKKIKDIGIELVIDDFGTGYSSLLYLKNFPVTRVKIDRNFIQDITINSKSLRLAEAIIYLAKKVDLKTIIEGVETEEQYKIIKETGADHIQGFYFSKPKPINELL